VGSPEKPLSDLGKLSYRSYWTYVILSTLQKHKDEALSIRQLRCVTPLAACARVRSRACTPSSAFPPHTARALPTSHVCVWYCARPFSRLVQYHDGHQGGGHYFHVAKPGHDPFLARSACRLHLLTHH
ncbi:hypothetical protein EON66_10995, partial [archaeon]